MNQVYLETSAVLTWLLSQKGAQEVRTALDAADTVFTSSLMFAETERALVRAEAGGFLRSGDVQRLRGMLQRAGPAWMTMAVSEEILARAGRPFPVEPVRTLDAVHLATALEFAKAFPELRVISRDARILDNAQALGLG